MMTPAQELEFEYLTDRAVDELLGRARLVRAVRRADGWVGMWLLKLELPKESTDLVKFRVRPFKYACTSEVTFVDVKLPKWQPTAYLHGNGSIPTEMREC